MKHKLGLQILTFVLACGVLGAIAWRYAENRRLAGNVQHDAQWFKTSLLTGNDRAVANYLSSTIMQADKLQTAMIVHARSLTTADFESIHPHLLRQNGVIFATFDCPDDVKLTFRSQNTGETWYVHEIYRK